METATLIDDAVRFAAERLNTPEPYIPRRMGSAGLWKCGDFTMKAYAIQRNPDPAVDLLSAEVAEAARRRATEVLRVAAAPRVHYGLGYCIVHAGELANWLLVDWWEEGAIVCQRLFAAPHADPCNFKPVDAPLMACVWELAIVSAESKAWMRHMLQREPDPAGYLRDCLANGTY